jgi:hypothetical protein
MFQKEEARLARSERPDALHGGVWVDAEPNQDGGELSLSRLTGQPYCRCDVPKRRSPAQGGFKSPLKNSAASRVPISPALSAMPLKASLIFRLTADFVDELDKDCCG